MADESNIKFPPRNLPGSAEVWGRKVEDTTRDLRRSVQILSQSLNNSERSTAGQLQNNSNNIDFLLNQNLSASKDNYSELQYSPVPPAINTIIPWNATYDPEIIFPAPESGSFRVQVSARIYTFVTSDSGTFVRAAGGYWLYCDAPSKSTILPEFLYNSVLSNPGYGSNEVHATVTGFAVFEGFEPGETCEIFIRRVLRGDSSGTRGASTLQFARWSQPAITVTMIR